MQAAIERIGSRNALMPGHSIWLPITSAKTHSAINTQPSSVAITANSTEKTFERFRNIMTIAAAASAISTKNSTL